VKVGAVADEHAIIVEGCDDAFLQLAARVSIPRVDDRAADIVFRRFDHFAGGISIGGSVIRRARTSDMFNAPAMEQCASVQTKVRR